MHNEKHHHKRALKIAVFIAVLFFVFSVFYQPSEKIISNGGGGALLYGIIFYYAFKSAFNMGIHWNNRQCFQYTIGLVSGIFNPLYRLFMSILHYRSKEEKDTPFFNKQFHLRTRSFGRFMAYIFGAWLIYTILSNFI